MKLPLFDASAPSFDACSQRWLWRYHTRAVQCVAAVALTFCSLAHPACFRKALCTLFVYTDRTAVSPFRTSNVIRSVRSSHLLLSSEIARRFSAWVRVHAKAHARKKKKKRTEETGLQEERGLVRDAASPLGMQRGREVFWGVTVWHTAEGRNQGDHSG